MTRQLQVGINGFGRFGLHLLRYWLNAPEEAAYSIRFINDDFFSLDQVLEILSSDPHVPFSDFDVSHQDGVLLFSKGLKTYQLQYTQAAQANIPWVGQPDLVLECSGKATAADRCRPYLTGNTKRVIISATSWDADSTLVYGFNHTSLDLSMDIVSYGSCTVNAYVPLADYIHSQYGLVDSDVNVVHNVPAYKLPDSQTLNRKFCTLEKSAKNLLPYLDDSNFMVNYTLVPYTGASLIDFRFRLQSPPLNRDALVQDLKQATQTGRLADLYGMVAVDQGPEEHILTPFSAVFIEENVKLLGDNLYIQAYFDTENSVNRYHDLVNYVAQATAALPSRSAAAIA
jgi:glyceraldehyde 3-phosphate dehydrogenase